MLGSVWHSIVHKLEAKIVCDSMKIKIERGRKKISEFEFPRECSVDNIELSWEFLSLLNYIYVEEMFHTT